MATATKTAPGAASAFGLPGISRRVENKENNDASTATLNQGSSTAFPGLIPFKQTDVIEFWELQFTLANTVTAGTATLTYSPYAPYNFLGAGSLNMQNQFNTLVWQSGVDLAIWQSYRPMRQTQFRDVLYQLPRANAYSAPGNTITAATYTPTSASVAFRLELPAAIWLKKFFPLDAAGNILGPGAPALVSPQYMSGSARIVTPNLTFNQGFTGTASPNLDQGPISNTGTQTTPPTFASVATLNVKRCGWYQPVGAADSPPVYNWQYTRQSKQFSLSGRSQASLVVPLNGQILSIFVRLFDPSSGAVGGAPIPLANVSECDVVYGPGLYRYQDTPRDVLARFIAQHGILPFTDGLLIWDMAIDEFGELSNANALNTMNTSGIQINLTFTGAQSSTAIAYVGVEALTYVEAG